VNDEQEDRTGKLRSHDVNDGQTKPDPWGWTHLLLKVQPRDTFGWLAVVASSWSLWDHIQKFAEQPDRRTATGSILLLLALASLALTEAMDWLRVGPRLLDIPPKLAWCFTLFALASVCLFYAGTRRTEAILGGLELGIFLFLSDRVYALLRRERGIDDATLASGALAGLIVGCGALALLVLCASFVLAFLVNLLIRKGEQTGTDAPRNTVAMSVAPLLLVVSVVMLPGVRGGLGGLEKRTRPYLIPNYDATIKAVEASIQELRKSDQTGVTIQADVRNRLNAYYAKASPQLKPLGNIWDESLLRDTDADFVFVVKQEGRTFRVVEVYERRSWCGF
jgi:hypothetical protein